MSHFSFLLKNALLKTLARNIMPRLIFYKSLVNLLIKITLSILRMILCNLNWHIISLKSLSFFVTLGRLVNILPQYSFNKIKSKPTHSKIYGYSFLTILSIFTLLSTYPRFLAQRQHQALLVIILEQTANIFEILSNSAAILSAVSLNVTEWIDFLTVMSKINHKSRFSTKQSCAIFFVLLFYLMSTTFVVWELAVLANFLGISDAKYFILPEVHHQIAELAKCLYTCFVLILRSSYRGLSSHLSLALEGPQPAEDVRAIRQHLRLLRTGTDLLNVVFGWQILLMYGHLLVTLLTYLGYALNNGMFKDGSGKLEQSAVLMLQFGVITFGSVLSTVCCDLTKQEGEDFVRLCYKLQQDLHADSGMHKELMRLARDAENSLPRFSTAEFFEIDKTTLMSFLGTAATYFVVVIQFNSTLQ